MKEFKGTKGPWHLCHHLQSEEQDNACSCGYRGGIWGSDQEHVVCEIGSTVTAGEEALTYPRYNRPTELANAKLIAAAPELLEALQDFVAWIKQGGHDGSFIEDAENAITKALN